MIIVTTETIPGYHIDAVFGQVNGLTVRMDAVPHQSRGPQRPGTEAPDLTKLLYETRHEAIGRMVTEAEARGANAVVAMQFASSRLAGGYTELCAYGTACFVMPVHEGEPGATGQSIQLTTKVNDIPPTQPINFRAHALPQGMTPPWGSAPTQVLPSPPSARH